MSLTIGLKISGMVQRLVKPSPDEGSVRLELDQSSLRAWQRDLRRAGDVGLPKRLGQANKSIGQLVINRLSPSPNASAVGEGRGAAVRPSASSREVLLRVGGAHRAGYSPEMQWGKRAGPLAFRRRPPRPYIQQTARRHKNEILKEYAKATEKAMNGAFHSTSGF